MALPIMEVRTVKDLDLLDLTPDPHLIEVVAINALVHAPLYMGAITRKRTSQGWICPNLPLIGRACRFADLLTELTDDILPKLKVDPEDRQTLRGLRRCGNGIWKVHRNAFGDLFHLTGLFSNCLTRAARQALDRQKAYTVSVEWINTIGARIEECRGRGINFSAPPLPQLHPQLPIITVRTTEDLHLLSLLTEPHRIELLEVDAIGTAPRYLEVISEKAAAGFSCIGLPHLRRVSRFADLLKQLTQQVLPELIKDPEGRPSLRKLRSCGTAIWKVRRNSSGILFERTGYFSNSLTRAARQALNTDKDYKLSHEWIHRIADWAQKVRDSHLVF